MKLFDYSKKTACELDKIPERLCEGEEIFILCRTWEITALRDVFGFDESTVLDCTDLDESVRYTNFDGYDFVSIVHIELSNNEFLTREINLYVSSKYLVLVIPEHDSPRIAAIENRLFDFAKLTEERPERINRLYYWILHSLLADFSDTLELLEDQMQELSEEIIANVEETQFAKINTFRNMAYTIKKQLRALSYLGEQILVDENNFIAKSQAYQFKSIDTRLKKLYDFSENLYSFASEMLYTYDSRLGMKTNDTVNKLTVITLFFGPLTVITGIYGMNFDVMPELHWPLGYPAALVSMIAVSLVLFFVFKKKKWL